MKRYNSNQFKWINDDKSGIDPKFPLTPQVEERIAWATRGLRERLERALDEKRQRASGVEKYVWHTQGDERVCPGHAANDGETFRWDLKPSTGHPGEAPGCRCWAEPVAEDGKLLITDSLIIANIQRDFAVCRQSQLMDSRESS